LTLGMPREMAWASSPRAASVPACEMTASAGRIQVPISVAMHGAPRRQVMMACGSGAQKSSACVGTVSLYAHAAY